MYGSFKNLRPGAQRTAERELNMTFRSSADGGPATINIYDEIGYFGISAQRFIGELSTITADSIDVHISSPGGEIFDGIAIMNALRDHPANITVYVDSLAASIASVIAMAGDRVVMAPHSELMIHDGMGLCGGNAAEMRAMADLLDRQSNKIAGVYAERAGGTADDWRALMQAETWFSAEEAVAAGLADEVSQRRPAGAPMTGSWDLSVFRYPGRDAAPTAVINASKPCRTDAVPEMANMALPVHHTATEDSPWDGPAAVAAMPSEAATLRATHAWRDAEGDPDLKSSYKFPHHRTAGGPANLPAVRNALARLPNANIPDGDRAGVEAHLRAHLEDAQQNDKADLIGWDPALFRDALAEAANNFKFDADTFKAILGHEANNAPSITTSEPAPEPVTDHYDPTVVTRALREATR